LEFGDGGNHHDEGRVNARHRNPAWRCPAGGEVQPAVTLKNTGSGGGASFAGRRKNLEGERTMMKTLTGPLSPALMRVLTNTMTSITGYLIYMQAPPLQVIDGGRIDKPKGE
jgi:hypothetical protein